MAGEELSNSVPKEIVTVTEHCRDLKLSRSRYYQLVKQGVFLPPSHDPTTKKIFVPKEVQAKNLEARRRNCGVNGKPILFYAKPVRALPPTKTRRLAGAPQPAVDERITDIAESIRALGIQVTTAQVVEAVKMVYPTGVQEVTGEVIRRIFLHLKGQNRRNTGDSVGE